MREPQLDTITQIALGACIAQAGFSKRLGGKSLVVGAVCGLIPDLDVLLSIGGDNFTLMTTHRGLSHSLLVLPFVAIPIAWLAMKWATRKESSEKPSRSPVNNYSVWYQLCFWTLITHPLLDLFTSYGTQIFEPVSNARFTLDAVSIIDLIYTVPLLTAVMFGIFRTGKPAKNRQLATFALIFSSLYLGIGVVNSQSARQVTIDQLSETSFEVEDVRASPTMLNILLWRVVAKDSNGNYAVGFFNSVTRQPVKFEYYHNSDNALVNKALQTEQGKIYRWFSTDMLLAQVKEREEGGNQVVLIDMRTGLVTQPVTSFFAARFNFDEGNNIERIFTGDDTAEPFNPGGEIRAAWSMIWKR